MGYALERQALLARLNVIGAELPGSSGSVSEVADGIVVLGGGDGRVSFANPAAVALLERSYDELVGSPFPHAPPDGQQIALVELPRTDGSLLLEIHAQTTRWEGRSARMLTLRDAVAHRAAEGVLRELNARLRQANDRLEALARFDPLTGLLNRRGLERTLEQESARARREDGTIYALLIDLDDFKRVNEGLGHAVGDVVLKEVARRVREVLRTSDEVGRLGGDEFLVILGCCEASAARAVGERIRLGLAQPMIAHGADVRVTASISIAPVSADAVSVEEALIATRRGLRASKSAGKNFVTDQAILQPDRDVRDPVADALEALRGGTAARAWAQPIFETRGGAAGRLRDADPRARWTLLLTRGTAGARLGTRPPHEGRSGLPSRRSGGGGVGPRRAPDPPEPVPVDVAFSEAAAPAGALPAGPGVRPVLRRDQ
ncbi:MAG: diguanylate cyclase [Proteobacteria bacterium]|nr:diguanylate cyclase [Pseudomonadota bacterium]